MKRLIAIQKELKAPKNQYNSFGKYKYRNCEDILEAVKPLLNQQGLALILNDEIISIENRFYVKSTATLFDDDGKQIIQTSALAREEETKKGMDGSQVTGASSSYARKYALNGLFCIDDTKDSDTTNTHGKDVKPNNDIDIIEGLKAVDNTTNALAYYRANKDLVTDLESFTKIYKQIYTKLKSKEV